MSELTETIDSLRSALAETPAAITFAKLPAGRPIEPDSDLPAPLQDLLAATDGPRCGSIIIFSSGELAGKSVLLRRTGRQRTSLAVLRTDRRQSTLRTSRQ